MPEYPEIENLKTLLSTHAISICIKEITVDDLHLVDLSIDDQSFSIYIQDEYNDLVLNNPLLNLCLILRELEIYQESSDYLNWSNTQGVNASNETLRQYYMNLGNTCTAIEKLIDKIDSMISDLDFQLNAGAAQEMRQVSFEL